MTNRALEVIAMMPRLTLAVLILAAVVPVGANERLSLTVSATVAFAPANLVVRTMVQPDAQNRVLEVVADSANFYRSSEIELDGEHAPRSNVFEFRSLPAGTYEIRATLMGPGAAVRATTQQQVNIAGNDDDGTTEPR